MSEVIAKLDNSLLTRSTKAPNYIQMEGNSLLKGIKFISPLYEAIKNKQTLLIEYKSFKSKEASKNFYYPYLLKEYRNRWFVVVRSSKNKYLLTLALDRILNVYAIANEKGLLFVDGQFQEILNAGEYRYWKNDIKVQIILVDVRQQAMDMNGQEILTKDKVQLRINFNLVYQIQDLLKAYVDNKDVEKQMYNIVQLMLREKVGRMSFDELMENKENLSVEILAGVREEITTLGIEVRMCGIKDIILPGDIREIMNQVLIAEKKAQANMITRREETAATRSLLNTAKLMEENEMLMRLKEMEYIEKIADKVGEISLSGGGNVLKQLKEVFSR